MSASEASFLSQPLSPFIDQTQSTHSEEQDLLELSPHPTPSSIYPSLVGLRIPYGRESTSNPDLTSLYQTTINIEPIGAVGIFAAVCFSPYTSCKIWIGITREDEGRLKIQPNEWLNFDTSISRWAGGQHGDQIEHLEKPLIKACLITNSSDKNVGIAFTIGYLGAQILLKDYLKPGWFFLPAKDATIKALRRIITIFEQKLLECRNYGALPPFCNLPESYKTDATFTPTYPEIPTITDKDKVWSQPDFEKLAKMLLDYYQKPFKSRDDLFEIHNEILGMMDHRWALFKEKQRYL